MNGNKIFIDTNIIIYILKGNLDYINKIRDKEIYISFISELEVLGYAFDFSDDEKKAKLFFSNEITIFNIDEKIKKVVIFIKKKYKIKLPDCVILATSLVNNIALLTNDINLEKIYYEVLSNESIFTDLLSIK